MKENDEINFSMALDFAQDQKLDKLKTILDI